MFFRSRTGCLICFCLILLVPVRAPADPVNRDPVEKNDALSRELSSELSSRVVVYEIDKFQLITSLSYDSQVRSTVIPNLTEAIAEFRYLFGVKGEDELWNGEEKGRLVLLRDRKTFREYVSLFEKEADPDRLSPGFADSVQEAQSFYWIEPTPYAVCCGQGAGFREINQHLFHLLGHILLTVHEYNYKFAPPWLHEGFGAYVAVRYAEGNILYCTQGLNNALFGTGVFKNLSAWARSENWPRFLKQEKMRDRLISFERLSRLALRDFEHSDTAHSWSMTTFLIDQYPEELRTYISALKKMPHSMAPDSNWFPVDFANETFTDVFGKSLEEIEDQWKIWVTEGSLASRDRDRSTKPTETEAKIQFDPAIHLEEFTIFEGDQRAEPFLAPFHKRTGEWMGLPDLESIRASWEDARQKLIAAMASWARKKLPGMDTIVEELASSPSVSPLSEKEIIEMIQPWPSVELCRPVIRYLTEKYGCYDARKRLQARIDEVGDNIPGSGIESDLQLLEKAAAIEADLVNSLAEKNVSVSVEFFPSKMKVLSADNGMLDLSARKTKRVDLDEIAVLEDIDIQDNGSMVTIRCPWSCINVKDLILLGKNKLKRKSEIDRFQYSLLCLFRGEESVFHKEYKFVKDPALKEIGLDKMMTDYSRTKNALVFLRQLASIQCGDSDARIYDLLSAFVAVKGSELHALHEHRATEVLRLLLYRGYVSGSRVLPALRGYQGLVEESETAHFLLEFEDAEDIGCFDCRVPRSLGFLNQRFNVEQDIETKPVHINDGALTFRGLGYAAQEPIFSGEIEATIHLNVEMMSKDRDDDTYYLLFGYGLDRFGAYVAAHGTTHLDIQTSSSDCRHLEIRPKEEKIGRDGITLSLRGTSKKIEHSYNDKVDFTANENGLRTGRVFFWVYGPVTIMVNKLEVKAKLDPEWLRQSLESAVSDDLKRLFDFSPRTVGN